MYMESLNVSIKQNTLQRERKKYLSSLKLGSHDTGLQLNYKEQQLDLAANDYWFLTFYFKYNMFMYKIAWFKQFLFSFYIEYMLRLAEFAVHGTCMPQQINKTSQQFR